MISTISHTTRPGSPGRPNEDWVGTRGQVVVVLDGLSAPEGVGGCVHGTPWYVRQLGERLLTNASDSTKALPEALRQAIQQVADQHRGTCDLRNPGTPSSTVSVVRAGDDMVEAMVLADSPVVVTGTNGTDVLNDLSVDAVVQEEREAALAAPTGSEEKAERMAELVRAQRLVRNTEGGYWIAGAHPTAADHTVCRSWAAADVERFAAMTDGVSCLVELYEDMHWLALLDLAEAEGVDQVVARVRQIEASDPNGARWPRYKTSDDATLAYGHTK